MTKRHFEAFAEEIGRLVVDFPVAGAIVATVVARVGRRFNPHFNEKIFTAAIKSHFSAEFDRREFDDGLDLASDLIN